MIIISKCLNFLECCNLSNLTFFQSNVSTDVIETDKKKIEYVSESTEQCSKQFETTRAERSEKQTKTLFPRVKKSRKIRK